MIELDYEGVAGVESLVIYTYYGFYIMQNQSTYIENKTKRFDEKHTLTMRKRVTMMTLKIDVQ